jgi:hypothetical protein
MVSAMGTLSESVWKRRFAAILCARFVENGARTEAALETAKAHAHDHYPKRTDLIPEAEAELAFLTM